jgi:type III restriction enzyme
MPRRLRRSADHPSLDIPLEVATGPCVPALREAVKAWRAGGCKGITDTTRELLNHWFHTDHRLPNGTPFVYHASQQEAIETLIFVWEVERVRNRQDLLRRYSPPTAARVPPEDAFARYCTKMATGSGKTKVMALAVAWQFLNSQRETGPEAEEYARTFLLIAPNVIVLERLKTDFAGARVFRADPVIPKHMQAFWDFDCVIRGEGEKAHAAGTLFLTNIDQLYDRPDRSTEDEPDEMTSVLGPPPPAHKLELTRFPERIGLRAGKLLVINDEGHHTHKEDSEWNKVIRRLHDERMPLVAQLDFSATPRYTKGQVFPWTISDYPLKQAIVDGVVKRPYKGIAKVQEAKSNHASVRYRGFLTAGVERWREYRDQLAVHNKKPVLFVMLNSTDEADEVGDWLRERYPEDFAADKTLIIHTDREGEVTKRELDVARAAARDVDDEKSPINGIVSVLMLREGWDVQNVTVVVGLRPYTAKANILPEQTIGRGLRLMFRGLGSNYRERVDILGNEAFLQFVDDLDKLEGLDIDTFQVGQDRLQIVTIRPVEEKAQFDIALPELTPSLVRKRSIAEEIAALDVSALSCPKLPIEAGDAEAETFTYEGYDIISRDKEFEREYAVPPPQTPQEVIGYYSRRIAEQVKLPSQFAALAPKVREFFETKAFGELVDLDRPGILPAMSTNYAHFVCVKTFANALKALTIEEQAPTLLTPARLLSQAEPFPWSGPVLEARRSIFNLVPCDNQFEREFAQFLDNAEGVAAFAKLALPLGFAIDYTDSATNLRLYYPDFVVVDTDGGHWLVETKGREDTDDPHKRAAGQRWCESATLLTAVSWTYVPAKQSEFEHLAPTRFSDLHALLAP